MNPRSNPQNRRMTDTAGARRDGARARRVIVWIIVVSFSLAAIAGILVLLGATLGETAYRVLSTTSVVGGYSVLALCCAALFGHRLQIVGIAGLAVVVLALALALTMIWTPDIWQWSDAWRWLVSSIVISVATALVCLLLLLAESGIRAVGVSLWVTVGLVVVLVVCILLPVWGMQTGDFYTRSVGILSILTALGAILVPVLALVLRSTRARAAVPAAAVRILADEAARRGVTIEQLVRESFPEAAPQAPPVPLVPVPPSAPVPQEPVPPAPVPPTDVPPEDVPLA